MIKYTIYFQDLKEDVQSAIWQAVQRELLSGGGVRYREYEETDAEFQQRLQEEIDYYINCHNAANEFYL